MWQTRRRRNFSPPHALNVSAEVETKLVAGYGTNPMERGNARSRNIVIQLAKGRGLDDVQIKMDAERATATLTNYLPALVLAKVLCALVNSLLDISDWNGACLS
jgi:hypothetical protein